nr:MAG TPA: hypothetical protein [Caudoviricetes sp.]
MLLRQNAATCLSQTALDILLPWLLVSHKCFRDEDNR